MPAWHLCLFHSVFSNLRLNNNDAPEKDKLWHAEPEGHSFLIPREFTGIEHRETHVVTCLDVRTGSLSSVTVPYDTLLAPAAAVWWWSYELTEMPQDLQIEKNHEE